MKRLHLLPYVILCFHPLIGGPAEDLAASLQVRKDAIALLRQGKLPESKQRLATARPAGTPAPAHDLAVGRQWVTIAFHFHARGEWPLARQAAAEALAVATTAAHTPGISSERAALLSNAGLICERLLRDLPRAKTFYEAALAAQPASQHAKELQRVADERIKQRATGKKAGA